MYQSNGFPRTPFLTKYISLYLLNLLCIYARIYGYAHAHLTPVNQSPISK
nr:MAG TPA: hypothetical protein [Caudoviricetes sp.]